MSGKRKGKKRRLNSASDKLQKSKKRKVRQKAEAESDSKMVEKTNPAVPSLEMLFPIDPLRHADLQTLISYTLQPYVYTRKPDSRLLFSHSTSVRKIIVVMMSYVQPSHVTSTSFPYLTKTGLFKCLPLVSPGNDQFALSGLDALLSIPSETKKKKKRNRSSGKPVVPLRRDECILSPKDLLENNFPVTTAMWELSNKKGEPVAVCHEKEMKSNGFARLAKVDAELEGTVLPIYAIDCEMCKTEEGMELTRISVVNESLDCVYDTLVKPSNRIIDYKTQFSGITKEALEKVSKTLADVQRDLQRLVPARAILAGHSLENDLFALKLIHDVIIDTTILYSTPESRAKYKPSLRYLSRKHLGWNIQSGSEGHCSIEDAKACMKLVKLKLDRGSEFGIPESLDTSQSFFSRLATTGKHVTFIDTPGLISRYCGVGKVHSIPCINDEEALEKACKVVERTDLLWVHFHEVEMALKLQHSTGVEDKRALEKALQTTDSRVKTLFQSLSSGTMCLVIAGSGDLHKVNSLLRAERVNSQLMTDAVKKARIGSLHVAVKKDDKEEEEEENGEDSEISEDHISTVVSEE